MCDFVIRVCENVCCVYWLQASFEVPDLDLTSLVFFIFYFFLGGKLDFIDNQNGNGDSLKNGQ